MKTKNLKKEVARYFAAMLGTVVPESAIEMAQVQKPARIKEHGTLTTIEHLRVYSTEKGHPQAGQLRLGRE